jgi:hypothetical protein
MAAMSASPIHKEAIIQVFTSASQFSGQAGQKQKTPTTTRSRDRSYQSTKTWTIT